MGVHRVVFPAHAHNEMIVLYISLIVVYPWHDVSPTDPLTPWILFETAQHAAAKLEQTNKQISAKDDNVYRESFTYTALMCTTSPVCLCEGA